LTHCTCTSKKKIKSTIRQKIKEKDLQCTVVLQIQREGIFTNTICRNFNLPLSAQKAVKVRAKNPVFFSCPPVFGLVRPFFFQSTHFQSKKKKKKNPHIFFSLLAVVFKMSERSTSSGRRQDHHGGKTSSASGQRDAQNNNVQCHVL
jgi:hypothetical protein